MSYIFNLKTEGVIEPLGLTNKNPTFSFNVKNYKSPKLFYKLVVATKSDLIKNEIYDLWESQIFNYKDIFRVKYKGKILNSDTIYYWAVIIIENGKTIYKSKINKFGLGLFKNDWEAKWVERVEIKDIAPIFLKEFYTDKKVVCSAVLYITGLGYFTAYCNNKKVSDDMFVPQVSDYESRELDGLFETAPIGTKKSIYYLRYDITNLIKENSNTLAVLVGNGWYKNREKPNEGNFYYGEPKCIFELRIKYSDGTMQSVCSDKTVYTADSNIIKNTLYTGEIIDFRKKNKWIINNYNIEELKICKELRDSEGALIYQKESCDRVGEVFNSNIIYKEKKYIIYDFKQNHSGILNVILKGNKGAKVKFTYAENLTEDGKDIDVYSTSWGGHIQTDELILSGNVDEYTSQFTIHGYRYCKVEFDIETEIINIKSLFVYSTINKTGKFECSNELFNKINRNYLYTQKSNFHGNVPTDCPHRERRGFLGDGHASLLAAIYNFDMYAGYKKWLKDIHDAQSETGYMPHTAPFAAGGGGTGFGSGCVIIPWKMYNIYGEKSILKDNYNVMINWIKYLNTRHDGDYIIVREEKGWCIGEWFNPILIDLDIPFVNTYFFALCVKLVLQIAYITDNKKDLKWLNALYNNITSTWINKYYDKEKHQFCKGTKGAAFFGLDLEILNKEEEKLCLDNTLKYYKDVLEYHIETGIFGTPLMLKHLSKSGYNDVIYKIMNRTDYPSYGFMIKNGATTLWEGFEKRTGPDYLLRDGCPQTGYGVSHNHPMLGSISEWFYKSVAGLNIDKIGSTRKIIIKPYFNGDITFANAEVNTVFGVASVNWKKDNNKININIEIPYSCYALFEVNIKNDIQNYYINKKCYKQKNKNLSIKLKYGKHNIIIEY